MREAYHQAIWGLHRLREALLNYDHPEPVTRLKALITARRELAETLPAIYTLLACTNKNKENVPDA